MPRHRPRPTANHNPRGGRRNRTPLPRLQTVPTDRKLTILADVHRYPPEHNAGAEWMLHAMLRYLVDHGHTCHVMADVQPATLDGVTMGPFDLTRYRTADVIVTHLDRTRAVVRFAHTYTKPLLHLVHNHNQLTYHRVTGVDATCVVFNSKWLQAEGDWWTGAWSICRPPVAVADYQTEHPAGADGFVTLVNLLPAKGAELFYQLATRMPDVQFLGVTGAYGYQMPAPNLPNLTVVPQTSHIRDDVYSKTSVVLMPSHYESWGRVAVEASCAGIPVVAHPTPGLTEALGSSAVFARHDRPDEWEAEIRKLVSDPAYYRVRSGKATNRGLTLETMTDIDLSVWETTVRRCVQ